MSVDASTDRPRATGRRIPSKVILWGLVVLVVALMAIDSTYQDSDKPVAGARQAFDRDAFGAENFPKVVGEIEKRAVDLPVVAKALQDDVDGASQQYGVRKGSSPYNFAVTGEGVVGKTEGSLTEVKVDDMGDATVSLQMGSAINGTSLRDIATFISFDQFLNQVDYADAATALNTEVKKQVLKGVDSTSLEGKTVKFTGAFTYLAPTAFTITPVKLEVAG